MMSPIGLWTSVLKPQVSILAIAVLFFLEPYVTIFGRGGGPEQMQGISVIRVNCDIDRDANLCQRKTGFLQKLIFRVSFSTKQEPDNMTAYCGSDLSSSGSPSLRQTVLSSLFYSKWDHNLWLPCWNQEDLKLEIKTIKSFGTSVVRQ